MELGCKVCISAWPPTVPCHSPSAPLNFIFITEKDRIDFAGLPTLQDEREKKWRVQAVAAAPGSFQSRKPLPAAWRGLRDEELSKASWTGVNGSRVWWALFRHPFPEPPPSVPIPIPTPRPPTCAAAPPRLQASGIPGGVFVHASGFIGGNATLEGAVEMARKALTMD